MLAVSVLEGTVNRLEGLQHSSLGLDYGNVSCMHRTYSVTTHNSIRGTHTWSDS